MGYIPNFWSLQYSRTPKGERALGLYCFNNSDDGTIFCIAFALWYWVVEVAYEEGGLRL